MYYIIILLIVAAGIFVGYSALIRRKIHREIDRFEAWKIDIMNRPVTKEISRVKDLNVIGETEQKFATWRKEWDEVVTVELPAVEEKLFDAEELADKYRFKKAKDVLGQLQQKLEGIESRINKMLTELNEVVDSEQQNRNDIVEVKETYHQIKKRLITRPDEFSDAVKQLEAAIQRVDNHFESYEHETGHGNYIQAREILLVISNDLDDINQQMDVIPKCYKEIRKLIPNRIRELESGLSEMEAQGYQLDHLKIDQQIEEMQKHLKVYEKGLSNGEVNQVSESITGTFEQFDWIYDQLNKEVESRQQLMNETPVLQRDLEIVGSQIGRLTEETNIVRDAYKIEDTDLKKHQDIRQNYDHLKSELDEVTHVIDSQKQAFSILLEKVEDMRLHVDGLRDNADAYKEKIDALRKDERIAQETMQRLRQLLRDTRRKMDKSNLPGVPQANAALYDEAAEGLEEVNDKLGEAPLDMPTVNNLLSETEKTVRDAARKADEVIEEAAKAERLIQYGNRYRSTNAWLDDQLQVAEGFFRNYNYRDAYEIAMESVSKVDPDALEQLDINLEHTG